MGLYPYQELMGLAGKFNKPSKKAAQFRMYQSGRQEQRQARQSEIEKLAKETQRLSSRAETPSVESYGGYGTPTGWAGDITKQAEEQRQQELKREAAEKADYQRRGFMPDEGYGAKTERSRKDYDQRLKDIQKAVAETNKAQGEKFSEVQKARGEQYSEKRFDDFLKMMEYIPESENQADQILNLIGQYGDLFDKPGKYYEWGQGFKEMLMNQRGA